jgi:hypothetical protein
MKRAKNIGFMCKHVLILIAVIIVAASLHFYYKRWQLTNEQFSSSVPTIPIEFVYTDTININNRDEHFDIFILDNMKKKYQVFIEKPYHSSSRYVMQKCVSPKCESMDRMDYTLTNYAQHPTIAYGDINPEKYIRVVEGFKDIEMYNDGIIINSVPIKVKIRNVISKDELVKMSSFDNLINTGDMIVYLDESEKVRDLYDLYACVWDDESKTATCQRIDWKLGTKPEIDLGSNKRIDMIRIKPKSKYI